MNERELFENWKSFAVKSGYEFQFKDQRHLQGTITSLFLISDSQIIFESKIGKSGSAYTYEWTKLYFEHIELPILTIKTKNSFTRLFTKQTDLEKPIQKIIKTGGACEITISSSEAFLKFEHILTTAEELQHAIELVDSIFIHLPRTK